MKFSTVVLAAVTATAIIPTLSNASEKSSLDACARAFADSFSSAPAYKVTYNSNHAASSLEYYRHEYSFDLQARDQKSGSIVATAKCSTNAHGEVVALVSMPSENTIHTLASR